MKSFALAVFLSVFIAAPAVAADFYAGVNIGSANIDRVGFGSSSSLALLCGYTIIENVATEVAYTKFGSESSSGVTSEGRAVSIIGIASLPMNDKFSFFAKFGIASTSWDISGESVDKDDWTYGFGGAVHVNERIDLRGSYDIFKVSNSVSNYEQKVMSAGAVFNF